MAVDTRGAARYWRSMRWVVVMMVLGILAAARPGRAQDCNANGVPDAADVFPIAFVETIVPLGFPAPGAVAAGRLGGDNATDLAIVHPFDDRLSLLVNDGDGGFAVTQTLPTGDRPEFVTIGRIESGVVVIGGDGDDVLVANRDGDSVSWFVPGLDEYAEHASSPLAVGDGPVTFVLFDFDADDDTDMIVLDRDTSLFVIFPGDGFGGFDAPFGAPTIAQPAASALGDLDGDGVLEILFSATGGNAVRVHYADGAPAPADVATVPAAGSLVAADLDGDERIDLAVVSATDPGIRFFRGAGDGSFTAMGTLVLDGTPTTLVATDFDGDGRLDLAVTRAGADVVTVLHNRDGFVFAGRDVAAGRGPTGLAVLDADVDGRPDLAVTNALDGNLSILRQAAMPDARDCDASGVPDTCERETLDCDANGVEDACELRPGPRFDAPAFAGDDNWGGVAVGDVDGDGRDDAVAIDGLAMQRFAGAADGTLTAVEEVTLDGGARALRAVDFEPDGDADLAIALTSSDSLEVRRSAGGTIGAPTPVAVGHETFRIIDADLDGDGDPELILATDLPGVTVLRNLGDVFDLPVDVGLPGFVNALTAVDLEPDGDLDVVASVLMMGGVRLAVLRNAGGTLSAETGVAILPAWKVRLGLAAWDGGVAALEWSFLTGDLAVVRYAASGVDLVETGRRPLAAVVPPVPGSTGAPAPLGALVLLGANLLAAGDVDGDDVVDLAASTFGRVEVFAGPPVPGVVAPLALATGASTFATIASGDVDGDGLDDVVGIGRNRRLFAARARRIRTSCAGAARPDECAPDYSDCNANALADACEPSAVDADADGVADCVETGPACANCRDDDDDGGIDLADAACPSTPLTVRSVKAKTRKRGGGRLIVSAEIPAVLDGLDATPPRLTVDAGGAVVLCDTVALRRRGKNWKLAARGDVLRTLVVSARAKKGRTKLRAVLEAAVPAGTAVRVSTGTAAGAFTGTGTPRGRR